MLGCARPRLVLAVTLALLLFVGLAVAASGASDAALVSRLAVLRRAQTSTDVLPAGVAVAGEHGTIIPSSTRLVASLPGASLYLALSTPLAGSPPLWNPRLGDQVGLVTVNGTGAFETFPAPALDLSDGFAVTSVGAGAGGGAYQVGIVPDGVARVRWTFANRTKKQTYVAVVQPSNNIAVTPLQTATPFLLHATWFAADGSVIPTSDRALRDAIAARDNVLRQRIIREDARHPVRPSPGLLAAFAVFGITSRTGVRVGELTISQPPLSSVPLPILRFSAPTPLRRRFQLDPEDMRQVTTGQGVSMWIIPGRRTLCVATVTAPQFPFRYGGGAGGGCSSTIAQAEAEGTGVDTCCTAGHSWHYVVVPGAHPTITIRTGPRTRARIQPPDGVYIYRTPAR